MSVDTTESYYQSQGYGGVCREPITVPQRGVFTCRMPKGGHETGTHVVFLAETEDHPALQVTWPLEGGEATFIELRPKTTYPDRDEAANTEWRLLPAELALLQDCSRCENCGHLNNLHNTHCCTFCMIDDCACSE